jgi:hypothetical protein
MLPAIQLNDQPLLNANDINDESPDWVLTAEAVTAQLFIAQKFPQLAFGQGCVAAKLAGVLFGYWRNAGDAVFAGHGFICSLVPPSQPSP